MRAARFWIKSMMLHEGLDDKRENLTYLIPGRAAGAAAPKHWTSR